MKAEHIKGVLDMKKSGWALFKTLCFTLVNFALVCFAVGAAVGLLVSPGKWWVFHLKGNSFYGDAASRILRELPQGLIHISGCKFYGEGSTSGSPRHDSQENRAS